MLYKSGSQPRSWSPPNTACFPCHLNQTHLIQIISSIVETTRPELGVSDKEEMPNVQCWGPPGTCLGTTAHTRLHTEMGHHGHQHNFNQFAMIIIFLLRTIVISFHFMFSCVLLTSTVLIICIIKYTAAAS